jgi:HEAT repeat protein
MSSNSAADNQFSGRASVPASPDFALGPKRYGLAGTLALPKSDAGIHGLIERIRSPDEAVSGAAWQSAGPYGAAAVQPLAALMADGDFELARKAKRALYLVVRHAGHPAAARERKAVERELIIVLGSGPAPVRREVVWMLSEIGSARAVRPMAALLLEADLREDARCALTRHPSLSAVTALKAAFTAASGDFKYALAESLRQRGAPAEGCPSRKLVPTAQTSVSPS